MKKVIPQFIAVCLGTAIGVLAFLYVAASSLGSFSMKEIIAAHYLFLPDKKESLTTLEDTCVSALYNSGHLITTDNLVGNLIEHYSNVVGSLLGFIALLGILGFFVVKASYKSQIEDAVNDHMESEGGKAFLELKIQKLLYAILPKTLEEQTNEFFDDIYERQAKLEKTQDRVLSMLQDKEEKALSGSRITGFEDEEE